jgi:hypothetical protein
MSMSPLKPALSLTLSFSAFAASDTASFTIVCAIRISDRGAVDHHSLLSVTTSNSWSTLFPSFALGCDLQTD